MTWFIFAGDMIVMLFMVLLVTWVFMVSSDSEIEKSAMIPLSDEDYGPGKTGDPVKDNSTTKQEKAGVAHG